MYSAVLVGECVLEDQLEECARKVKEQGLQLRVAFGQVLTEVSELSIKTVGLHFCSTVSARH